MQNNLQKLRCAACTVGLIPSGTIQVSDILPVLLGYDGRANRFILQWMFGSCRQVDKTCSVVENTEIDWKLPLSRSLKTAKRSNERPNVR